jgi:hypothetical protein
VGAVKFQPWPSRKIKALVYNWNKGHAIFYSTLVIKVRVWGCACELGRAVGGTCCAAGHQHGVVAPRCAFGGLISLLVGGISGNSQSRNGKRMTDLLQKIGNEGGEGAHFIRGRPHI